MNVHNLVRPRPDSSIAATTQVPAAIVPRADRAAVLDVEAAAARVSAFEQAHSLGELGAGMSGLEGALDNLATMAWYVERAVERGAGQAYDLDKLERIKGRIAEVHQKVEISAGRIAAKLAGAR